MWLRRKTAVVYSHNSSFCTTAGASSVSLQDALLIGRSEVLLGSNTCGWMTSIHWKVPDSRNPDCAVATLALSLHAASKSLKNCFLSGFLQPVSLSLKSNWTLTVSNCFSSCFWIVKYQPVASSKQWVVCGGKHSECTLFCFVVVRNSKL